MAAIVEQGQCLIDATVQHCGDIESLFNMALQNNLSITDNINAGTELSVSPPTNAAMSKYFKDNGIIPATGWVDSIKMGLNWMELELDFKVS